MRAGSQVPAPANAQIATNHDAGSDPSGSQSKYGALVASKIVREIIDRGWPIGEVIGSEAELLDRFAVSRTVFREAVRLVEHQNVARTRRGPRGGLVVTEPTVEAVVDAAVLYLFRVNARLDEVFEAREVVEEIATELVPDRLDEADSDRLRQLVADEASGEVTNRRALHSMLASMTRNPAIELFVDILNRVTLLYFSDPDAIGAGVAAESGRAHARIVDAVRSGNGALARRRMRTHLHAEFEFLRRRRATRQVIPSRAAGVAVAGQKRAEGVAHEIFHRVVAGRLQPGDLLGSEPDLMEHYGVSRAVFREAVRLLEHDHVATMRRGRRGGLIVAPPSPAAVTDVVAVYLAWRRIEVAALVELRIGIELALVDLVVDHLDAEGRSELDRVVAREVDGSEEDSHGLHVTLAHLSGNSVLELLALVLIRLTRLHQVRGLSKPARADLGHAIDQTHRGIVAALQRGDRDGAKRRLRRHLEVLSTYLR